MIMGIIFLIFSTSNAQVELETVYLNDYTEEMVYTNNFSVFNTQLIEEADINFRLEIKKAKESNTPLLYISERNNLENLTSEYLKTIRKGANKNPEYEGFIDYISEEFPELINQFKKDNNLKALYIISRKNTFNGRIAALPSVL